MASQSILGEVIPEEVKWSFKGSHSLLEDQVSMEIVRTAWPERERSDIRMWLCGSCDVVHVAVGKMVLNFNREEFSEFAEAVFDISMTGWLRSAYPISIVDLIGGESESVH